MTLQYLWSLRQPTFLNPAWNHLICSQIWPRKMGKCILNLLWKLTFFCVIFYLQKFHANFQYDPFSWFIKYCIQYCYYTPASTKLKGGYTGITLSVCPSVDRTVSALYLQQYSSDPFHICTSYQATSEGVSRVMPVSKFKNLNFVTLTLSSFDLLFLVSFLRCHCRLQFRMDSFHIWYKWSIAWEGVSHVMTFDLDLYLQGHSALT